MTGSNFTAFHHAGIAVAARFAQRESAFIDMPGNGVVHAVFRHGAYDRRWRVILGQQRRCGGRMSATPRPAGIRPCRVGRLVLGKLRGENRGSELDIWSSRLIGGRRRDCRVLVAVAGRLGHTRQFSLRRERVAEVRRWLRNYRKLKEAIQVICELNYELLRPEQAPSKRRSKPRD
jgi:hypothetical protein